MSCTNATCVEYRIQHKNMTLKKIDLEKELEVMQRIQATHYNNAVVQNAITQIRDAATGEMGLMMPNGEVMTKDKVMKKMEISARCMETSAAYEKVNRDLLEENRVLKSKYDKAHADTIRLEQVLSGFERTRKYTLTDEAHSEALRLNDELADEIEVLERRLHRLQEANTILSSRSKTAQSRTRIADDDEGTVESHITVDGRIPAMCPINGEGCVRYEPQVLQSTNPVNAFKVHMARFHRCVHCRQFVKDPKAGHEQMCETRKLRGKIGRKKPREELLNSEDERTWEQFTLTPNARSPVIVKFICFSNKQLMISQEPESVRPLDHDMV